MWLSYSFDMSRAASSDTAKKVRQWAVRCDKSRRSAVEAIEQVLSEIQEVPEAEGGSVARIAIQSFGSPAWLTLQGIGNNTDAEFEWLHKLRTIKGLMRNRRAVALFTVPGWFHNSGAPPDTFALDRMLSDGSYLTASSQRWGRECCAYLITSPPSSADPSWGKAGALITRGTRAFFKS